VKKYLNDQYTQYGKAKPNVMADTTRSPSDMIKYSQKFPVNVTVLPSISNLVKNHLNDQYVQYGKANPNVITDRKRSPKDIMKYSPNPPLNETFLLIIFVF